MKPAYYFIPFLAAVLPFLIKAEFESDVRNIRLLKPLATFTVILTAVFSLLHPEHDTRYSLMVIAALLISLGGDTAMIRQSEKKFFMTGLLLFLTAHIVYIIVFSMYGQGLPIPASVAVIIVSAGFFLLIRRNLGAMTVAVVVYMIIISAMVVQAFSLGGNPELPDRAVIMVAVGSVLFYISDVILASNRFYRPWKYNRISLLFYYSGQMLIALSTLEFSS